MVSVLIPAYNAEKTICRCLESVLAQTVDDFEVIIVNDGSKDSTWKMMQEYEQKDSRIRAINQSNAGVAAARNTLLRAASGEFLMYIDSDDWIEPEMLERMLSLSKESDIVFCGSDHAETPSEVKQPELIEIEKWDQERRLLEFMKHKRMTGMLWNKLIRRRTAEGCSFNPQTGYGEDAEFLWQVLKNSKKMVVTNEVLYHHTLEQTSISHLSFSEKKYSAIPMWEKINREVEQDYSELLVFANERLVSTAVYSMYEIHRCKYQNVLHISHLREITRKHIKSFVLSTNVSIKFKLYALAICMGY